MITNAIMVAINITLYRESIGITRTTIVQSSSYAVERKILAKAVREDTRVVLQVIISQFMSKDDKMN